MSDRSSPPLQLVLMSGTAYFDAIGTFGLLLHDTECEIDIGWYNGPGEGFTTWQRILDPFYYERSMDERTEIAFDLASSPNGGPDTIRRALILEPLSLLDQHVPDSSGKNLLNEVAWTMGWKQSQRIPASHYPIGRSSTLALLLSQVC